MPRKNCGAHSSKATDRPAINWCRSNVRFLTNRCRSNNRFPINWSQSTRRFARKRCGWRSRRRARRAGCRRCGGVKFDQVKVRGRLVGLRLHTRPTIEWMTKASWSRHAAGRRRGRDRPANHSDFIARGRSMARQGPATSSPSRAPRPKAPEPAMPARLVRKLLFVKANGLRRGGT